MGLDSYLEQDNVVIATDIDEVLADYIVSFLSWYNKINGTKYTRDMLTESYELHESLGNTQKYWISWMKRFYEEGHVQKIGVLEGAKEGLAKLAGFEIHAVTARPTLWHEHTNQWVSQEFSSIYEVHSVEGFREKGRKARKCKEIGAKLIIEDNLSYANECVEQNIKVVLMDAPWNRKPLPKGVARAYSWSEIPGLVHLVIG